jgi:biopolymer transport protein ExbD
MTVWLVILAVLAVVLVAAIGLILRMTHRLPARERLHQDPEDIAAPISIEIAEEDSLQVEERDRVA